MATQTGAKILTIEEYEKLPRAVPKSLLETAGIWRHKKVDPVAYQRKIRREWEIRLRKQNRLGRARKAV